MDKIRRTLTLCGIAAAFCFGSCISMTDELDLDKQISLDMHIGPGGLTIPLGSLSRIYLDSLLQISDGSTLDTLDGGIYGIKMRDSIDEVELEIDQVTITVDNQDIDPMETHFDSAQIDNVEIPEDVDTSFVKIEKIDLSTMKLPNFNSSSESELINVTGTASPERITYSPSIDEQTMDCSFNYDYPNDLKKLNTTWFGPNKGSRKGQKLTLKIDFGGVFDVLSDPEITISGLTITFPNRFTVKKDTDKEGLKKYIDDGYVSANDNVFSINMGSGKVKNLSASNRVLPITFYLEKGDFSEFDDQIDIVEQVVYNVNLKISGLASSTDDKSFQVFALMKEDILLADVDADTEEKSVDVARDTITSECVVSGLDGASRVNTIKFFEESSYLYLSFSDLGISPFELKNNDPESKIVLRFPEAYEFDKTYCKNEENTDAGTWSGSIVTLDPHDAIGHTVKLKVLSLKVDQDVNKETASITIVTDVDYDGTVLVAEGDGIDLEALDKLKDKELLVTVWGLFEVDADHTEVISDEMSTDFNTTSDVSIKQKVDDQLRLVRRIDLKQYSDVEFKLIFVGVPESVHELNFSRFTIAFPDYMQLIYLGGDKRVKAVGNRLIINGILDDTEIHDLNDGFQVFDLKVKELKFSEKDGTVVKGYLEIDKEVLITGSVTASNQQVTAGSNDITVYPTVKFAPMDVKAVYGKVDPSIEKIKQAVSIDMGEGLDFFKEDNNNLSISDPTITLNLNSTVTVPIYLDLKLSTKNSDGEYIKKNIAPDNGKIRLEKCDSLEESRTTTIVISKNERTTASKDTMYVRMSRLPELLSTIPDSIIFEMTASADQSVHHYVDLDRKLAVSGNYDVSVPLTFDSLYIEYNDTIKDLGLEDIGDKIEAAKLLIVSDVESTIPLGVILSANAYDKYGQIIPAEEVEISTCVIKAGADTVTKSVMELGLSVKKGGLSKMESIILSLICDSGSGNVSIHKGQWLDMKKIRLVLPEGIKIDLTEDKNKKDGKKK